MLEYPASPRQDIKMFIRRTAIRMQLRWRRDRQSAQAALAQRPEMVGAAAIAMTPDPEPASRRKIRMADRLLP